MNRHFQSSRYLTALAAACLLSAAPALAKTKTKAPVAPMEYKVDIPTITAVDASVDEATLRAIFSGDIASHADELAGLDATSITVPTISFSFSGPGSDGKVTTAELTLSGLTLTDVTDGIAATASLPHMQVVANEVNIDFGDQSASNLDLGSMLAIYGLVPSTDSGFKTIYTDAKLAGGTLSAPTLECSLGAMTVAKLEARPLKTSFSDMMSIFTDAEAQGNEIAPETLGKILKLYPDLLTAIRSTPIEFGGVDCTGTAEDGQAMAIKLGGATLGGYEPGFYPKISFTGLDVSVGTNGSFSLGSFVSQPIDLSSVIATLEAAPDAVDQAWLEANMRGLIPAYSGFSFSDLAMDVPNTDKPTERVKASVGAFDLALGNYVNGIPTDVKTSATHVVIALPQDGSDEQIKQLIALGVTSLDLGFGLDVVWNAKTDSIMINDVSVSGADLASVKLSGALGQATAGLFSLDLDEAMGTAMSVVVKSLNLDIADAGLSDLVLTSVAAEQGSDAATMRPVFAGLAEGTIVSMLVGVADAQNVGEAVSDFIAGTAKSLTISLSAKEEPGLGMADFMAAQEDPSLLIGKVNITATAK